MFRHKGIVTSVFVALPVREEEIINPVSYKTRLGQHEHSESAASSRNLIRRPAAKLNHSHVNSKPYDLRS